MPSEPSLPLTLATMALNMQPSPASASISASTPCSPSQTMVGSYFLGLQLCARLAITRFKGKVGRNFKFTGMIKRQTCVTPLVLSKPRSLIQCTVLHLHLCFLFAAFPSCQNHPRNFWKARPRKWASSAADTNVGLDAQQMAACSCRAFNFTSITRPFFVP